MKTPVESVTYSVKDLSCLLKLSERTVWRLSDAGEVPGKIRIGGSVRWSRAVVDSWIAKGCPKSPGRARGGRA